MGLDIRGLAPLLQVYDMPTSVRFYRDLLGFEVVMTSPVLGEDRSGGASPAACRAEARHDSPEGLSYDGAVDAPVAARLVQQREGDDVRAGGDCYVLLAVEHVGHGRGFPRLVGLELPEGLAGGGIGGH